MRSYYKKDDVIKELQKEVHDWRDIAQTRSTKLMIQKIKNKKK